MSLNNAKERRLKPMTLEEKADADKDEKEEEAADKETDPK